LFSILGGRVTGCRFLDLYAGTGAIGIEAVSRGAAHVTCVESQQDALALLRRNVSDCGMAEYMIVRAQTVTQFLRRPEQWQGRYDIVFADPPYAMVRDLAEVLAASLQGALLAPGARLVIEHGRKSVPPETLGICTLQRAYRYGDTMLSLYAAPDATPL
jgi:16S rRNA (guanine(966)-N(2))-methyltransferase RsmD